MSQLACYLMKTCIFRVAIPAITGFGHIMENEAGSKLSLARLAYKEPFKGLVQYKFPTTFASEFCI